jgi:hypothetical protein
MRSIITKKKDNSALNEVQINKAIEMSWKDRT